MILTKVNTPLFILILASWSSAGSLNIHSYFEQTSSTKSSSSSRSQHSVTSNDNEWHWKHSENGVGLEVKIRGNVEFTDDYSDITNISDGGSIFITDDRGGTTRKFEAKAGASGIQRTYWVNGATRQFDREASAWLAKVLDDTVRQGGYDAKPRVKRILMQSGPDGVLQEISRLKGDYVKRIYFDELIENGNLDDQQVRQVLRQAAAEIKSDYEKAQLLIKMSQGYVTTDNQRSIYLEGVNTLHSDYEKGRTIGALIKKGNLSHENMLFVLGAVKNISSEYERAQLLIKIADATPLDESVRVAYVDTVATMKSDYEKGRALSAFVKKGEPATDTLLLAVKGAANINSDYEKAQFLIKVAAAGSKDEAVRNALMDAARSIQSDYERGRVLSAVVK
ncbi:MAG TPA: hypothetical protein VKN18_03495 [Blastocatellia bacterium]|nr:hypothetical protein [Blastocatellia bacterium]